MILTAVLSGDGPLVSEWLGLFAAVSGLIYLLFPGLSTRAPVGSTLTLTSPLTADALGEDTEDLVGGGVRPEPPSLTANDSYG